MVFLHEEAVHKVVRELIVSAGNDKVLLSIFWAYLNWTYCKDRKETVKLTLYIYTVLEYMIRMVVGVEYGIVYSTITVLHLASIIILIIKRDARLFSMWMILLKLVWCIQR